MKQRKAANTELFFAVFFTVLLQYIIESLTRNNLYLKSEFLTYTLVHYQVFEARVSACQPSKYHFQKSQPLYFCHARFLPFHA